jgi:hypothetical protein
VTRYQIARILAGVSAFGFFFEAVRHTSEYRQVILQAERSLSGSAPLVSALWLAFAAAMLALGAIVALVALARVTSGRWILALAAGLPLVTVLLQLHFLEFTRSTAILSAIVVVSLAAAIAFPSATQPAATSAA